ncbi:MAG: hypothetical protein H6765_09305 [Candidatus Peribacteria bacterium]|nr:MAG: hypothetical protein H6765_09305 [Candidatus Peribacteria bacterium]
MKHTLSLLVVLVAFFAVKLNAQAISSPWDSLNKNIVVLSDYARKFGDDVGWDVRRLILDRDTVEFYLDEILTLRSHDLQATIFLKESVYEFKANKYNGRYAVSMHAMEIADYIAWFNETINTMVSKCQTPKESFWFASDRRSKDVRTLLHDIRERTDTSFYGREYLSFDNGMLKIETSTFYTGQTRIEVVGNNRLYILTLFNCLPIDSATYVAADLGARSRGSKEIEKIHKIDSKILDTLLNIVREIPKRSMPYQFPSQDATSSAYNALVKGLFEKGTYNAMDSSWYYYSRLNNSSLLVIDATETIEITYIAGYTTYNLHVNKGSSFFGSYDIGGESQLPITVGVLESVSQIFR